MAMQPEHLPPRDCAAMLDAYYHGNLYPKSLGLPTVEVQWQDTTLVQSRTVSTLVDTGAEVTYLSDNLAKSLNLKCTGSYGSSSQDRSRVNQYWSTEVVASIGGVSRRHYAVVGGDLTILGAEFLAYTQTAADLHTKEFVFIGVAGTLPIAPITYKKASVLQHEDTFV